MPADYTNVHVDRCCLNIHYCSSKLSDLKYKLQFIFLSVRVDAHLFLDVDIFQWRNFGVSSSTEEFSITPLVTFSLQSQISNPSISVLPKNKRQQK